MTGVRGGHKAIFISRSIVQLLIISVYPLFQFNSHWSGKRVKFNFKSIQQMYRFTKQHFIDSCSTGYFSCSKHASKNIVCQSLEERLEYEMKETKLSNVD